MSEGSKMIASTDPEVEETAKRLDAKAEEKPKRKYKPRLRVQREQTETDYNQIIGASRAMLNSSGQLWDTLTHPSDIAGKAIPYLLIGAGVVLLAGQYFAKKSDEEES